MPNIEQIIYQSGHAVAARDGSYSSNIKLSAETTVVKAGNWSGTYLRRKKDWG